MENKHLTSRIEETIAEIKGVIAYLTAHGWYITRATMYRHIEDRKLKRNKEGVFNVVDVEKYARKYLKCLDVKNENSQAAAFLFQDALKIFFDEKAEKIVNFLGGNISQTEELKALLRHETREFFKLQAAEKPHIKDDYSM